MSYTKAMKHARNIRKCRKQGRMHFGFDTGSGSWPNPRRGRYMELVIEIREWFGSRHRGNQQHTRECIREAISDIRALANS